MDYVVKPGDTLSAIAASNKTDVGTLSKINNIADPNKIAAGSTLKLSAGPTTQDVPGIGTLTITPKGIPTPAAATPEDLSGAYARAGITPPAAPGPEGTANGYVAPKIPGVPSFPSGVDTAGAAASIKKSYDDTLAAINTLESRISSAAVASPEEQQLQKDLAAKKAALASFDLGSLQASEDLSGQGRGATLGNLSLQDTKLQRTRALERLGLAQEADTLTTQLGLAQDSRKNQGELATTEYNLATKKLDIALGVQEKIQTLAKDEQNNARQFLLDTVNFANGKAYNELDAETQAAITHAVANSPITLDMVRTALKSGAEKAAAAARGDLRTVAGVGVVMVKPDGTFKVVVPENPQPAPASNVPTFEQYLEQQNLPVGVLSQKGYEDKIAQVHAEYDKKYGNASVSLGKLTPGNKNDLAQSGLSSAPPAVQSYFLNAPAEFRDSYQRDIASGKTKGQPTLDALVKSYTDWYNANNKKGSTDWASILNSASAK